MSTEVKRYKLFANLRPEAIPFLPDEVVSAADYDALRAEAEALRADNADLRAALAEQGERQEAAAWTVAYPPEYKPFMHHLSFGSESEAARYAQQKTPKAMGCVVVALYTTPQPGPDVRGLVEAMNFACKSLCHVTSSDGSGHADIALSVLRMAGVDGEERERLVDGWKASCQWRIDKANRQAQQGGSNDT